MNPNSNPNQVGERRSIARSARLELDEAVAATQRAERKLQQLPLASKGGAAAGVGPRWALTLTLT